MELSAEEKRSGSREEDRQQQRGTAAHWNGGEVKALLVVWREREGWDEPESRAKYEAISSRLRDFGIIRDWLSCQTQSRAMALPDWRPPPPKALSDNRTLQRSYEMSEEHGSPAKRRDGGASISTFQEGMEGGRHWSDKEIRALLAVWADREFQGRLQSTHRNRAIFQEMARRLEVQHGVVRDWRQCRTKYKNLKYDYKVSKDQGRFMRFFAELDAILQGKVIDDGLDEDDNLPREGPEGDHGTGRLEPGEDNYIKIDDDEILADMKTIINTGSHALITKDTEGCSTSPLSRAASDDPNVITVHDSGRNWTEEEVAALLNIWAEDGIQQQLQVSTRNKDVFVQISRRLLQQGVERDWKQCRTKYKNLKYLYRSLQRGKADMGDTRRIMKFYEQLDNILSKPSRGLYGPAGMFSPTMFDEHSFEETNSNEDSDVIAVEFDHQAIDEAILRDSPGIITRLIQTGSALKMSVEDADAKYEERAQVDGILLRSGDSANTGYGHSSTAGTYDGGQEFKVNKEETETTFMEREHAMSSRRRKRKATDEDFSLPSKRFHQSMDDGDSSTDWSENIDYQCKEEPDPYIPIMEITSVCSMASNIVTAENLAWLELIDVGNPFHEALYVWFLEVRVIDFAESC